MTARTLNAEGRLIINGEDFGDADYQLTVIQDHRGKFADGVLNAEPDALAAAIKSPTGVVVRLSSGAEAGLVVRSYTMGQRQAVVGSSGDVPGL